MQMLVASLLLVLGAYLLGVRHARFQRRDAMLRKYGPKYATSAEEAKRTGKPRLSDTSTGLQGIHDAQRIMRTYTLYDQVFIAYTSLQFALFITYGIPSISTLLKQTGQLSEKEAAPRRYVDTASLIASYISYPLPPLDLEDNSRSDPEDKGLFEPHDPRATIAIARTNWLHDRWRSKISRDDMLFTLCTFVQEPPAWAERYEWRVLTELEKEASFAVWRHIGRCFGIADIPETREALAEWREAYEREHMVFDEANRYVADKTVDLLLWNAPKFLHPFGRQLVVSLMFERLRISMGYERPPQWIYTFSTTVLRLRALFVKHLLLPRTQPRSLVPHDLSRDYITEMEQLPAVCPASRARAGEGRTCPVGGHAMSTNASTGTGTGTGTGAGASKAPPAGPRMMNVWFDVAPIYSLPAKPYSARWLYERIARVPEHERWGGAKWRSAVLGGGPKAPVDGLGGFRLEEMGPVGLERKGVDEVRREAERLNGGRPLVGPWAISSS